MHRGLNLEVPIQTVNYAQDNGTSARTAFVAPFQGGTQNGQGQEDRGGVGIRNRPTNAQAPAHPPSVGVRLPARLIWQGAVSNDHTQDPQQQPLHQIHRRPHPLKLCGAHLVVGTLNINGL